MTHPMVDGTGGHAQRLRRGHHVTAIVVSLLLLLFLLLFLFPFRVVAASAEVIVNPDHASVTLDRDLLRGIFTMRVRQWPGGGAVQVFVLPDDNALSDEFYRKELGTYPYVLRANWDRMVFTGTGFAPTVIKTEQEMRERVRTTPGSIGFVAGGKSFLWPSIFLVSGISSAGSR